MTQSCESHSATHKIQFIVFTGPSQSGKTIAANCMAKYMTETGITVYRDSFEQPVRHYLAMLCARKILSMPFDEVIPILGKTPRDFMFREQQHMRMTYGPDVLGRLLRIRSEQWTKRPKFIIVDDGTSINDVRALGEYKLIRVDRSREERVYPFTIPNPHFVLSNRHALLDLQQLAKSVADVIMGENCAEP